MSRQHTSPLVISADGAGISRATALALGVLGHGLNEAAIQRMVQTHPACLPIAEIDPLFLDPVPICMELSTPAGSIDNFMVTASGLPVLVECKLWRNPEGRREVVGQILDYSKELTRWSSSDLQREAGRRLGREGNVILDLVRKAGHDVDEISFNDALTHNLRRGRFLLLIVGDGIREGVEAIAEYLQAHAGLHFTLGLVEMPIYGLEDGSKIIVPRVLARTQNIVRTVVAVSDGFDVEDDDPSADELGSELLDSPERIEGRQRRRAIRQAFWSDFLSNLHLDDPEQMKPRPALGGNVVFKFGAPGGSSWLTAYRDTRSNTVGVFLSGNRNSPGERAMQALVSQADEIRGELGPDAKVSFNSERPEISQTYTISNLENQEDRARALEWLCERTNTFINVLRPRIRSALREISDD